MEDSEKFIKNLLIFSLTQKARLDFKQLLKLNIAKWLSSGHWNVGESDIVHFQIWPIRDMYVILYSSFVWDVDTQLTLEATC